MIQTWKKLLLFASPCYSGTDTVVRIVYFLTKRHLGIWENKELFVAFIIRKHLLVGVSSRFINQTIISERFYCPSSTKIDLKLNLSKTQRKINSYQGRRWVHCGLTVFFPVLLLSQFNYFQSYINFEMNKNERHVLKHFIAVDQLSNESLFKFKHGFKLNDHLKQCRNFCNILRKQAEHVQQCNRRVGMFI